MGKIGRFLSDFTYFFQTLKWVVFRKYQVSEPLIGSSCYILWVFQTLFEIFENFHFLGDFWAPKGQKMQFFAIFRNFSAPQWPEITEKWKFKKIPNNVWNIYEMQQHDQLWGSEDQQCSKISHFEYFQKQKNEGFISCGISIGFRKPYQIWDITESQREKLFLFCKKFLKVQNPDF